MRFAPLFCTCHDDLPQRPWPQTPERAHLNPVCLCLQLSVCVCVFVRSFPMSSWRPPFSSTAYGFFLPGRGRRRRRRAGGVCYRIWFVLSSAHKWKCTHTHTHANEHTSVSCVLCSLALYIKRCQTSQTTTTTTEAASAQSIPFLDSPKTVTDAGHVSGRGPNWTAPDRSQSTRNREHGCSNWMMPGQRESECERCVES